MLNIHYSLLLILAFAYAMKIYAHTDTNILRIIGGRNASVSEFPYVVKMVLLKVNNPPTNYFICSSIVLTSTWTLTAAHCIRSMNNTLSTTKRRVKGAILYRVSSEAEVAYSEILYTVTYPGFLLKSANDIGLLQTKPILMHRYGKLSPIEYIALNGQEVAIVGYGMTDRIENIPSLPIVLDAIVKICPVALYYPGLCFARSCASKSMALCPGDSGGPAVHASGVVAINTLTDPRDCGFFRDSVPRRQLYDKGFKIGTATPLSPFLDWISRTVTTKGVAAR